MCPPLNCIFCFFVFATLSCAENNYSTEGALKAAPGLEQGVSSVAESSDSSNETDPNTQWKYLDASFYSIKYPSTWELDTTGIIESSFVLFAPAKSQKNAFRENISFLVQKIDEKKMGINEYTELSEQQIRDRLAQSVILKSSRSKTGELECHTLVYTSIHYSTPLKYFRKHWVVGSNAYALCFTCEEAVFEKFEPLVNEVFDSFQLKLK